jgi:hypothetical protein
VSKIIYTEFLYHLYSIRTIFNYCFFRLFLRYKRRVKQAVDSANTNHPTVLSMIIDGMDQGNSHILLFFLFNRINIYLKFI